MSTIGSKYHYRAMRNVSSDHPAQGSATHGPRAKSGLRNVFMWPAGPPEVLLSQETINIAVNYKLVCIVSLL